MVNKFIWLTLLHRYVVDRQASCSKLQLAIQYFPMELASYQMIIGVQVANFGGMTDLMGVDPELRRDGCSLQRMCIENFIPSLFAPSCSA